MKFADRGSDNQVRVLVMNSKAINIVSGSALGILAGLAICLTLKYLGIDYDPLSSSLIVAMPAALGIVTSLAIF